MMGKVSPPTFRYAVHGTGATLAKVMAAPHYRQYNQQQYKCPIGLAGVLQKAV